MKASLLVSIIAYQILEMRAENLLPAMKFDVYNRPARTATLFGNSNPRLLTSFI
jgi:hypothetical protein